MLRNFRGVLPLLASELGADAAYRFLQKHDHPHILTSDMVNANAEKLQELLTDSSRAKAFAFMAKVPKSVTVGDGRKGSKTQGPVIRALDNLKVGGFTD